MEAKGYIHATDAYLPVADFSVYTEEWSGLNTEPVCRCGGEGISTPPGNRTPFAGPLVHSLLTVLLELSTLQEK